MELDDVEERSKIAVQHATFEFMSLHSQHFDERHSKLARNAACSLPPDAGLKNGKVCARECACECACALAYVGLCVHEYW